MLITDNYVFFWREYLSQWKRAKMSLDGFTYNCCEQYMMHQKALLFEDGEAARRIMTAVEPSEQKALGRAVRNFDQTVWDANKMEIVFDANFAKFSQNSDLREKFLSYGTRQFVEASPNDPIWGIGMDEVHPDILNTKKWGQNLLGIVLTNVRNVLEGKYDAHFQTPTGL